MFGLFLVFFLCLPQLVFSAVGVGYLDLRWSLKMLAEDKTEDAAMWITYWCLFSLLKVVMNPLDFILGFLPFYFYLKFVLLVWLFSPTTKGGRRSTTVVPPSSSRCWWDRSPTRSKPHV